MSRDVIPVGEGGRIILPRELRRALGVEKGSRNVIEAKDDRPELASADRPLFPDRDRRLVDVFLAEKGDEARREGDRGRWVGPSTGGEMGESADDTSAEDAPGRAPA